MEYAYNKKPAGRTARARISRVNCSWKDLSEVCRNVRYRDTDYALDFLARAAEGEQAILFLRHCKKKGHRRELGGKKGGFPVKSCRAVLGVVESADANAIKLGLGATKIVHIAANKHATYPRMSPKGRRIRHDYEVAFIEVVLEEKQQRIEKAGKKADAPKKEEVKKADVPKVEAKKTEVKAEVPKKAEAAPQKSG
ncbi:MAG: 50S ribosomal protein L22 [Candidatus Micrarchaeota archaeon]|nr:50S ribosomal protein L22 [Candidatus Micrarchaeota archaeon]